MNFKGYVRSNGRVGVRNHVLIFPTIICASSVAQMISREVPGTVCVSHPHGCGHLGVELEHMLRTMAGFCANPNVAGVLLVGLGCELITPEMIGAELGKSGQRYAILSIQKESGSAAAIEKGRGIAQQLVAEAAAAKRHSVDVSELIVGVKCGGSDTLSGLTANPALGFASDILVKNGSTVIMTEVPEMLGAEQVLLRRSATDTVKESILRITGDMEASVVKMGVDIRGTEPSPGNIAGGLTTLEEKSLGAILKGGTTMIKQVTAYAERPAEKGLIIMDGPALDAVSLTGMLAAGAQIIVFTTGRGSPLGAAIAPVIKVATNTNMYQNMQGDMDLNAGELADGKSSLPEMGERIFREIIAVASGKATRSEILGHCEFAIHSIGPAV
ncbi:MAG TPA: UxaA family hydrolase [Dehalococcoidales bacterium]